MNARLISSIGAALCGLALAAPASAWLEGGGERDEALHLTPDIENGRDVYEVCAGCHLPEGWGTEDGTFPQLAGQHRGVLIKQLADIREGNRDNPTMYPFALPRAIGDAQALADVVEYIEKLRPGRVSENKSDKADKRKDSSASVPFPTRSQRRP